VLPGAVQITNDGLPVVLGVDGQTIGGYPKLAHVIRADWDRLGRLRAGDSITWKQVTEDEAENAWVDRNKILMDLLFRIRLRRQV
jgi:allophanate hydrolase subunit 2